MVSGTLFSFILSWTLPSLAHGISVQSQMELRLGLETGVVIDVDDLSAVVSGVVQLIGLDLGKLT